MSKDDPKRLLDGASALERSLLRSHRSEETPDDLEARILVSLGTTAAPVSIDPPLAKATSAAWLKPIVYIGGAVAIAAAVLVATRPAPTTSTASPSAAATTTTTVPRKEEAAAVPPVKVVTPDSLPDARPPTSAAARSTSVPRSPTSAAASNDPNPSSSSAIAREVEILDGVKSKLGSGEAAEAARGLSQYDREFPNDGGTLRPEATVLRIRMHLMQGDRQAAETIAQSFLSKHPDGVHAKRIRSLLGE